MLPVMAALAGLSAFSSCASDDYEKYNKLDSVKNGYYNSLTHADKFYDVLDFSDYKITKNKDSINVETADYIGNEIKIRSKDEVMVIGEIIRKKDNMGVNFITNYEKNGRPINTILIDQKTKEKFFVNYDNDNWFISTTIKNDKGEPINDEQYSFLAVMALSMALAGFTVKGIYRAKNPKFKINEIDPQKVYDLMPPKKQPEDTSEV